MKGFIRARSERAMVCLAALVLVAALPGRVHAQEPFSTVHVGLAGGADLGEGRFHDLWSSSPALSLIARMPFHLGQVEAGLSAARNTFRGETPPMGAGDDASNQPLAGGADYWRTLIHVGWGPSMSITPDILAYGAVMAGNYLMIFDSPHLGYAQRENEIAFGAAGGLTFYAARWLGIYARLGYSRVFTSTPIDIVHVSAGLETRLTTPSWVRALLR